MNKIFRSAAHHRGFLVLLLFLSLPLFLLQFSYDGLQQDDYYHARYSEMLRHNGIMRQFPWMEHSILNKEFYDFHFLYHLLLLPFTFGNLIVSAKIAAIVFALAAVWVLYWVLTKWEVKNREFWCVLFVFGSNSYLLRLLALRPISLASIFYILTVYFLIEKKYVRILPLSYLFVLAYAVFPVMLVIVLVYTVLLKDHRKTRTLYPFGFRSGSCRQPFFPE